MARLRLSRPDLADQLAATSAALTSTVATLLRDLIPPEPEPGPAPDPQPGPGAPTAGSADMPRHPQPRPAVERPPVERIEIE
jgi:hypothetical protein